MDFSLVLKSALFQRPHAPAPGPEGLSDAGLPRGVCLRRPLQGEAQNAAGWPLFLPLSPWQKSLPTLTAPQAGAASRLPAAKELVQFYT